MKRSGRALLAVVSVLLGSAASRVPAMAQRSVQASCRLAVDGRTYLDGRCPVYVEPDGSFTLNTAQPHRSVGWFAFVSLDRGGGATASWNGEKGVDHADAPLGAVRRKGACWVNQRTQICAER